MVQTPTQIVANNARAEAARMRVSQARIAEALGQSQQAVSRRMHGLVPFRIDELYTLADLLGTTVDKLLPCSVAASYSTDSPAVTPTL